MTTLRQFILAGSALTTGNTIRDHLNNQAAGGGDMIVVIGGSLNAEIQPLLSANIETALTANIDGSELTANIENTLSDSNETGLGATICQT